MHEYSKGESQTIAIIDSGIAPSLSTDNGNSFSLVNDNIYDINGHGTMMYSIIKGYKDDIIGVSPETNIITIKVLDRDESVKKEKIYEAIKLAIEQDVTIINLSIASYKYDDKIAEIIKRANNRNITVVASSGDYSDNEVMFPANMNEVVSVGAIGERLEVLDMTSGSNLTTINAPGENVLTLGADEEIFPSSGTSQATAIISGYIAIIKDYANKHNIKISNKDILKYLKLIKEEKFNYVEVLENMKSTTKKESLGMHVMPPQDFFDNDKLIFVS